jgi:hypothetical protein
MPSTKHQIYKIIIFLKCPKYNPRCIFAKCGILTFFLADNNLIQILNNIPNTICFILITHSI